MVDISNYSNISEKILKIAQHMYQNRMVIDFDYLLNRCIKELRVEKNYILLGLYELEQKKLLCFGKKTVRNFMLANNTRKIIYSYIKENYAVRYSDIKDNLNLNPGVIQWNIEMLMTFGCIKTISFAKKKIYTINECPYELAMLSFIIRNLEIRKLIENISNKPMTVNELALLTGCSYDLILPKVKMLVEYKIFEFNLERDKKIIQINHNYSNWIKDPKITQNEIIKENSNA